MKIEENDILLRIYVGEKSRHKGKCVYEQIVLKAKELNLAGATVLRGILGFGASHHLHSSKLVDISENLPVVVEIVDREESINKILPWLDQIVDDGFVTMEKVSVIRYRNQQD